MQNIKHYDDDSFEFHKKMIEKKKVTKKDPKFKERLNALNENLEKKYETFNSHFLNNELETIKAHGYENQEKIDLLNLYSYKSKVIQELKVKITTSDAGRIINTCQNCTINEINSFDHFIPKDEFPEFVVNPKNLFPSCTKCNSLKNVNWRLNDSKLFLNLYLDVLPEQQYLFVKVNKTKNTYETKFTLRNDTTIENIFFKQIEYHYNQLLLLERFSENNDTVITGLRNSINSFMEKLPLDEIIKTILEKCEKDKKAFGYNYWKSILEIELVKTIEFLEEFKK